MAGVISEVRARFSATAQGLMNTIRDIREDMTGVGDDTQDAMQDANHSVDNFQDALDDVNVNHLTSEMEDAGNAAQNLGDEVVEGMTDAERYAQRAENVFKSFRKTFLSWTAAAAGIAVVATGIGTLATVTEEYNRSLNQVQAATGASVEETQQLGEVMKGVYANNYGADWQDVADSLIGVKKATGETGDALRIATERAILLRDTFGYEVPESSKVASQMMKQFGITSEQAFELIAQGAQQGLDVNGDMLDSFHEYSVYFKTLGFDAEGMWNVFKAGAEGGAFNMDKVGDAIKELGIRVKDNSESTAEGFAALGLNADEMAQKFAKGGDSAQEALGEVFAGLAAIEDPIARNAAGVALFGTQFEDLEYETIAAMGTVVDQANMAGDALNYMDAVKYDTIGEALVGLGRQIEVNLISKINEKVMPILNEMLYKIMDNMPAIQAIIMQFADGLINTFTALAPTFENVFGILRNVAPAIITPLNLAFQGLMAAIGPILNTVTDLVQRFTGLSGFAPTLAGLIAAFVTYQATLKLVQAAQVAWAVLSRGHIILLNTWRAAVLLFNSAWLANPIGLVIAALVGLGVALYTAYQKSETFRNIVNQVWQALKDGFAATINWFTTTLPAWIASVIAWFQNLWNSITTTASSWGASLKAVWDSVAAKVSEFVTKVSNFFQNTWTAITIGIGAFVDKAKQLFNNFVSNIMYIVEPIVEFFKRTWTNIKDIVLGIVGVFTGLLTGDMKAVQNALKLIWLSLKDQFVNITTTLKDTVSRLFEVLKSGVTNIVTGLKNTAVNVFNSLKSTAVNAFNALKDGAVNAVKNLYNSAVSQFNSMKSSVTSTTNDIKSSVSTGFNNAKQAAIDAFRNMVSGIATWIGNAKSKVTEMKTSIISTVKGIDLFQIGKDIVSGLVRGLGNMLGSLKNKAKEIADTVKKAVADKLKIKSPSRVMMGMGVNIGEGLVNGMGEMVRKVGKVAGGMASAVTDNMDLDNGLGGALSTSASVNKFMTFKHLFDLQNVPSHIDEHTLTQMLIKALGNPTVQRRVDRVNAENELNYKRPMGAV